MAQTIQDRLIAALKLEGWRQLSRSETRTSRYIVMVPDSADAKARYPEGTQYFLGSAGALRRGRSASNSIPADKAKERLLAKISDRGTPTLAGLGL